MELEPDTCRICSTPAEPDAPLFHPCKCSGTIKYIHQECLKTWLEHSKKRKCDVCHYPYAFTKVYSPEMPERIPAHLFIRRMAMQSFQAIKLVLRASLVSFVWLIALPYATVICWRFFFYVGEQTAWWILHRPRFPALPSSDPFYPTLVYMMNLSIMDLSRVARNSNGTIPPTTMERVVRSLSSDIFTGQIIASLIFISFVAVFLLREYILQHVRPEVLDEPAQQPQPEVPRPIVPEMRPTVDTHLDDPRPRGQLLPPLIPNEEKSSQPGLLPPQQQPNNELEFSHIEEGEKTKRNACTLESKEIKTSNYPAVVSDLSSELYFRPSIFPDANFTASSSAGGVSLPTTIKKPTSSTSFSRAKEQPNFLDIETTGTSGLRPLSAFTVSEPLAEPVFGVTSSPASRTFRYQYSTTTQDPTRPSYSTNGFALSGTDPLPFLPPGYPKQLMIQEGSSKSSQPTTLPYPIVPRGIGSNITPNSNDDVSERSINNRDDEREKDPADDERILAFLSGLPKDARRRHRVLHTSKRPGLPPSPGLTPTEDKPQTPGLAIYRPPEELDKPEESDYFLPQESEKLRASTATSASNNDLDASDDESTLSAEAPEDDNPFDLPPEEVNADVRAIVPEQESDSENEEEPARILDPPEPRNEPAGIQPQQPRDAEANPDFEDDMDDVLGAIGMRGPLRILGQHAVLMIFILNFSIGVGVWIPYVLGKSVALMTLDPKRIAEILNYPILAVRYITDPIVDFVIYGIKDAIVVIAEPYLAERSAVKPPVTASDSPGIFDKPSFLQVFTEKFGNFFEFSLESSETTHVNPLYATLQKKVHDLWRHGYSKYSSFAYGDTASDRALAVLLGYGFALYLAAGYLYFTSSGQLESAARVVRRVLKQQLIVFKVIGFMTVELLVFPLFCGLVLDISTLGVFKNATVQTRWAFLCYAPITTALYYWLVGTIYMFHFAVTLSMCRGVMRPGAMWFIKDPQDPHFQPVKDILERRTIAQVQKLGLSALMYGVIIATSFGISTWSLHWLSFGGVPVLPLRWYPRKSLARYPVELMYMHLVAPCILRYFKPRRSGRRVIRVCWRFLAQKLRLSAYMFGGEYPQEQLSYPHWFSREGGTFDGGYRRVPNRDSIALIRNKPAIVETDKFGFALTEQGREVIKAQNAECVKLKREVRKDYAVIYVPPQFRLRIVAFICGVSLLGIFALTLSIGVPVPLGRHVISMFTSKEVHDGYSFIIGCSLVWSCFTIGKAINDCVNRRLIVINTTMHDSEDEQKEEIPRANWALFIFKQGIRWLGQALWLGLWLGVVIPILVAIVFDLYLVVPLRSWYDPAFHVEVDIPMSWLSGLLYSMIGLKVVKRQPGPRNSIMVEIDRMRRLRIGEQDILKVTSRVILPLFVGLVGMIILPPLVCMAASFLLHRCTGIDGFTLIGSRFIFEIAYPMVFVAAALSTSFDSCTSLVASWSQAIRDNEFLLEMRLKNIDHDSDGETAIN